MIDFVWNGPAKSHSHWYFINAQVIKRAVMNVISGSTGRTNHHNRKCIVNLEICM